MLNTRCSAPYLRPGSRIAEKRGQIGSRLNGIHTGEMRSPGLFGIFREAPGIGVTGIDHFLQDRDLAGGQDFRELLEFQRTTGKASVVQ